ncbi:MAG: hypothetical protein JJU00_03725 [Opitutales bacterium]|nr:hypothetical protein [Opitutales bacterium]
MRIILTTIISLLAACLLVSTFAESPPSHLHLRVIEQKQNMERVYDSYSILTSRQDPIALEHALEDVKVPDAYLWVNAARYLGSLGREEAIPYLIKALRHTASRGDDEIVGWLEDLTKKSFGADFDAWRSWWLEENPDFQLNWKSNLGHRPRLGNRYEPYEIAEEGKGSVGKFLADAIKTGGAQIQHDADLSILGKQWRYSLNSGGATIYIFEKEFEPVARFLRDLLGEPDPEQGSFDFPSALARRQGFYSIEDKKVGIRYVRKTEGVVQVDLIYARHDAWQ